MQRNREKSLQQSTPPVTSSPSSTTSGGADMASCPISSSSVETTSAMSSSSSSQQQTQEQKEVAAPGPMDIVLGRGKNSKSSPGYLRLRGLVEDHCDAYDKSERFNKMRVVNFILKDLRQSGCRFVRITPEGLTEATPEMAREKVAHAFRDVRRARRGGRNAKDDNSNTNIDAAANHTLLVTTSSSTKTAVKRGISEAI